MKYFVITGPTASGKSQLAMHLARQTSGEIISYDSVQLYKGFDIGSAKPTSEEREEIPHHMLDVVSCSDAMDAEIFAKAAREVFKDIQKRGKTPILVGGTGLYLRSFWLDGFHGDLPKDDKLRKELGEQETASLYKILKEKDPDRATEIHANDRLRIIRAVELVMLLGQPVSDLPSPPPSKLRQSASVIYLNPERTTLHNTIEKRTQVMLDLGLVDEVKRLRNDGCPAACRPMQSIGYKEINLFIDGKLKKSKIKEHIVVSTRQYAKKQWTWFNKIPHDFSYVSVKAAMEETDVLLSSIQAAK